MGTPGRTLKMNRTSVILLLVTVLLPEIFCGDSSQDWISDINDKGKTLLSKLGFTNDQTPNLNDILQNFKINEETLGEITSVFTENEDKKKLMNALSDKEQLKKLVNEKTELAQAKVDEFVEKIQDKVKDMNEKDKKMSEDANQANVLANSTGERGMSLYCGVLLALVIFFK